MTWNFFSSSTVVNQVLLFQFSKGQFFHLWLKITFSDLVFLPFIPDHFLICGNSGAFFIYCWTPRSSNLLHANSHPYCAASIQILKAANPPLRRHFCTDCSLKMYEIKTDSVKLKKYQAYKKCHAKFRDETHLCKIPFKDIFQLW